MNPDNPTFRTPEEERRAKEYVVISAALEVERHRNQMLVDALEKIVAEDDGNPCVEMVAIIAREALAKWRGGDSPSK